MHLNQEISAVTNENGLITTASFQSPTLSSSGIVQPLDQYRIQLYNYAMVERLRRTANYNSENAVSDICPLSRNQTNLYTNSNRFAFHMSLFQNHIVQQEEPKPQHSYIGLIAIAILNSPETKLVLSDIYHHILDNYPYFRSRGPGWRNSIRHNLSLNDCFIKAGRSANGKGHYWAIHPANLEDFKKRDFRRRKAQRKVRRHMGLVVDDEGTDSPSPPLLSISPSATPYQHLNNSNFNNFYTINQHNSLWGITGLASLPSLNNIYGTPIASATNTLSSASIPLSLINCKHISSSRKRQFDVASLLAPDEFLILKNKNCVINNKMAINNLDEHIDADTSAPEDVHNNYCNINNNSNNNNNMDSTLLHGILGSNLVDSRILSRYYGQCMATTTEKVCRSYLTQSTSNPNNSTSQLNNNFENSTQSSN